MDGTVDVQRQLPRKQVFTKWDVLAGPSPRSLTPYPTYVSNGELFIESDPKFIRSRDGIATDERESPAFRGK